MNIKELNNYLQNLKEDILSDAAEIVAETATEHFKRTFRNKAWDGNPWQPARTPKQTGSLLIDSGALLNSIRPAIITRERVVISAGNDKVHYAQVHNEGYHGNIQISRHVRHTKKGQQTVRAHSRRVDIPQRQFIGDAKSLNDEIHTRIEQYINNKTD